MQTIKVKIELGENEAVFSINTEVLATIWQTKGQFYSEMKRCLHPHGQRQEMHSDFTDAFEFVVDAIHTHLVNLGIDVDYVEND